MPGPLLPAGLPSGCTHTSSQSCCTLRPVHVSPHPRPRTACRSAERLHPHVFAILSHAAPCARKPTSPPAYYLQDRRAAGVVGDLPAAARPPGAGVQGEGATTRGNSVTVRQHIELSGVCAPVPGGKGSWDGGIKMTGAWCEAMWLEGRSDGVRVVSSRALEPERAVRDCTWVAEVWIRRSSMCTSTREVAHAVGHGDFCDAVRQIRWVCSSTALVL